MNKFEYNTYNKVNEAAETENANANSEPKRSHISVCKSIVIDASITGTGNVPEKLSEICNKGNKIILTSITIKELEKLQKKHNIPGKDARHILLQAVENPDCFDIVEIDETVGIPDDCIVNYCKNNKENVMLLTSDKTMALKARMYSITVEYVQQPLQPKTKHSFKTETLENAHKEDNNLVIYNCQQNGRIIRVYSRGVELNYGPIFLRTNDEVYIAERGTNYILFKHCKVIVNAKRDNCIVVFAKKLYSPKQINALPPSYKRFVKDCKIRYDM